MRAILCLLLIVSSVSVVFCQNPIPIEISYDAAGNRVTRKVLEINSKAAGVPAYGKKPDNIDRNDSTYYLDRMQTVRMKVYPNPTSGRIYVKMSGPTGTTGCILKVFDSRGRKIHERSGDGPNIEIDLSAYPAGYYIVELTANGERTIWKVIKR